MKIYVLISIEIVPQNGLEIFNTIGSKLFTDIKDLQEEVKRLDTFNVSDHYYKHIIEEKKLEIQ